MRITYSVESVVTLDDTGAMHLLDLFARIKSGEIPHDVAPPGFVAAIDKLTTDASKELILRTIIGEVTSQIIASLLPRYYPPNSYGFSVRIPRIEYQETPEPLPLPADAQPVTLLLGNLTKH